MHYNIRPPLRQELPALQAIHAQLFEVAYEPAFFDTLFGGNGVHALVAAAPDGSIVGVGSARAPRPRSTLDWVSGVVRGGAVAGALGAGR